MIIVEGLDNTGKTTLAERIAKDFPKLEYIPSIGNKHNVPEIRQQAWDSIEADRTNPLRLWERSRFISEYIYNPILASREIAFDIDEWFTMLNHYVKRPQLLIYVTRNMTEVFKSFDEREQLGGVYENLWELHYAYEQFMSFMGLVFNIQGMGAGQQQGTGLYAYDFQQISYEDHLKPIIEGYVERFS